MSATTLFPESQLPPLAAERPEPLIWIERIQLVEALPPDGETIREISFRRGLNIVRTAVRTGGDARTVGHSVGKTMLVRLLRYCLGERTFGTRKQQLAISAKYERAWVLAVIHVNGQPWSVARPIGLDENGDFSACGAELGLVRRKCDERRPFKDFIAAIESATAACFASLPLPHTKPPRPGRWLDLLAWIARDQDCRYRHHHEWRDPDSESGTGQLKLEDAGLLIRMAMGLLGEDEGQVIENHRILLKRKGELQEERDRLRLFHEVRTEELRRELHLDEAGDQVDLFTRSAAEEATARRGRLKRLLSEIRDNSDIAQRRAQHNDLSRQLREESRALGQLEGILKTKREELRLKEKETTEASIAELELLGERYCEFFGTREEAFREGCPGKHVEPSEPGFGAASLWRERDIERIKQSIRRLEQDVSAQRRVVEELEPQVRSARQVYETARNEQNRHLTRLGVRIGRAGELRRMAIRTKESWQRLRDLEVAIATKEREIRESSELQDKMRERLGRDRRLLSQCFDHVLKHLVDPEARGTVNVEAKGVLPEPDLATSPGGAAITTSATVLSFDLACLLASCRGLGEFPRLLIHDSPREADMEPQMYHQLFRFVAHEESGGSATPNFQYIVTTTTPPPDDLPDDPYVRETLHRRDNRGLLFRCRL